LGFVCFFQPEDGIRDFHVTGVQTCALPIFGPPPYFTSTAASQHQGAQRAAKRSKYGGEPSRWNQRITGCMGEVTLLTGWRRPAVAAPDRLELRVVRGIFPDSAVRAKPRAKDKVSTPRGQPGGCRPYRHAGRCRTRPGPGGAHQQWPAWVNPGARECPSSPISANG